jgi:hypothetical protein
MVTDTILLLYYFICLMLQIIASKFKELHLIYSMGRQFFTFHHSTRKSSTTTVVFPGFHTITLNISSFVLKRCGTPV